MLAAVKIVFLASLLMPSDDSSARKENVVAERATSPATAGEMTVGKQDATVSANQVADRNAAKTAESVPAPQTTAAPTVQSAVAQAPVAPRNQADTVSAAREGNRLAQIFLAELAAAPRQNSASAEPADPQAALALASSRSALSLPRLLGASVAYAADMPPVQPVMPPAPTVRPMDSPIAPERVVRPDEITPQAPPAPEVAPFVSRDSAAQKQAELNRREQELLALQQQMESRMAELHSLENRIQGMLQDANTTQDSKFKQMVDMYANMKPRQAAQALSSMDETIAVKILTGMKSKQSGEVLSYMDSKNAARLSEVMSKMQL